MSWGNYTVNASDIKCAYEKRDYSSPLGWVDKMWVTVCIPFLNKNSDVNT